MFPLRFQSFVAILRRSAIAVVGVSVRKDVALCRPNGMYDLIQVEPKCQIDLMRIEGRRIDALSRGNRTAGRDWHDGCQDGPPSHMPLVWASR